MHQTKHNLKPRKCPLAPADSDTYLLLGGGFRAGEYLPTAGGVW
jgi:hypothetical protein